MIKKTLFFAIFILLIACNESTNNAQKHITEQKLADIFFDIKKSYAYYQQKNILISDSVKRVLLHTILEKHQLDIQTFQKSIEFYSVSPKS